jgi:enoyl-CoA hydratase
MAFATIRTETRDGVGAITLNRPDALNALSTELLREVAAAISGFELDGNVGCILITGSERAFAAGADIKEMQDKSFADAYLGDLYHAIDQIAATRKPMVAAVAGYALGGGCELAMACDIVIAADTAKFGQPEITLGIMPGLGGTQRLPRLVGKARAMDLILTARQIGAEEAERIGLVSRVVPANDLLDEAFRVAAKIGDMSLPIVMMAKEAVSRAFELPLAEGVRFERRLFQAMFATADQKEGMAAFVEKRAPQFRNR